MKKKLLLLLSTVLLSCNNAQNQYKENLNTFKNLIEEINSYFLDTTLTELEISNYYTEDFVFHTYPAGHKKGVETFKTDYINGFREMKKMNRSINIDHVIYLPGIDSASHKIDGSVRLYYGAVLSVNTNDIEFSGYQTVNFEKGKISEIWEWSDYGGVSKQLQEYIE